MTIFQLDECLDCRSLVRRCEAHREVATVYRFPGDFKTKEARQQKKQKDKIVVPHFIARGNPIVTTDLPIIEDNLDCISEPHPGFIIVSNETPTPTIRSQHIVDILGSFKQGFPDWISVSWRNSVVRLTQKWIEVGSIKDTTFVRLWFSSTDWRNDLLALLKNNSERSSPGSQIKRQS
jgi:hypothetical protein